MSDRLAALARAAEDQLRDHILPFWLGLRDADRGGFAGGASSRGRVLPSAAKGAVLQSRILWFFSSAYLRFGDAELLDAARLAYRFIADRLIDPQFGGVYWTVDAQGHAADTRKHVYAQAFAIYGLAAFYRASGDPAPLALARGLWETIESRAADPRGLGYFEAFSREWQTATNELIGWADVPKSFNTHLHLVEAYGALWEVWPDTALGERLVALLELLIGPFLDREMKTFRQAFDAGLLSLDEGLSHGHDIEASWLLPAIARSHSPGLGARASEAVIGVADAVLQRALGEDGGLATGYEPGGVLDLGRVWWVQAEALVGFVDAFERHGAERFLTAAERVWDFIDRVLVDRVGGEWRWRIDPGASAPPVLPKAHLWKGPYHNGRACMELIDRAARLSQGGV